MEKAILVEWTDGYDGSDVHQHSGPAHVMKIIIMTEDLMRRMLEERD